MPREGVVEKKKRRWQGVALPLECYTECAKQRHGCLEALVW